MPLRNVFLAPRTHRFRKSTAIGAQLRQACVDFPQVSSAELGDLADELSHQYRITYARPQRLIPPNRTDIKTRNPELTARGMLVLTDEERERLSRP